MKLDREMTPTKRPFLLVALFLLLGAILFPYGLLAQYSDSFRFVVDWLFSSELAHIAGHFSLFFLAGMALLRLLPQRWWLYFSLMLLLGLAQEGLQLATFKLRPFAWSEVWDLTVDLLGAAAAFWLVALPSLPKRPFAGDKTGETPNFSINRHHVLLFLALVLASLLALSLLTVRVIFTGQATFIFLVWNLFLAWIPLGLAMLLQLWPRGLGGVTIGGLWLLFFPNALYIITDLLHLRWRAPVPPWFDALMVFTFALTGLLLGFVSLRLVQTIVRRHVSPVVTWGFVLSALALSGFGVYIGRFLRWNSWDMLLRPSAVLVDIVMQFFSLSSLVQLVGVTGLLTAVYLLSYVILVTLPAVSTAVITEKEPL